MKNSFASLRGMRILVTGHTGFKGSWLVTKLKFHGVEVVGISDRIRENSLYSSLQSNLGIEEYFLDIRDRQKLDEAMFKIQPDGILHLAAQAIVLESYINPIETFETNIMGTANVIWSALRFKNLKFLIVITTDKVYKNDNSGKSFREEDPLGGHDPYSTSKAAVELITESLRNIRIENANVFIPTVRAGNVIGGGDDSKNRLLPDITRAILEQSTLQIRNPSSTRPWQHVLDPLTGYIQIADCIIRGQKIEDTYNLGPSENSMMSVSEVVGTALRNWDSKLEILIEEPLSQPFIEAKLLALDSTRALNDLKWRTKLSAVQAINWQVEWEKRVNKLNHSPYSVTIEQIEKHHQLE
jgi:CDP-glucose 4,6-dehydratase